MGLSRSFLIQVLGEIALVGWGFVSAAPQFDSGLQDVQQHTGFPNYHAVGILLRSVRMACSSAALLRAGGRWDPGCAVEERLPWFRQRLTQRHRALLTALRQLKGIQDGGLEHGVNCGHVGCYPVDTNTVVK